MRTTTSPDRGLPLTQAGFLFDIPPSGGSTPPFVHSTRVRQSAAQPLLWTVTPEPAKSAEKAAEPETSIAPSGLKGKAKATLTALRLLKQLEAENCLPTAHERRILAGFSGFGLLANHIFPEPGTDHYKAGWEELGKESIL